MVGQILPFSGKPVEQRFQHQTNPNVQTGKNDENSQLLALRAQIIKAYGDFLPFDGEVKKRMIENFAKILDEKNIKRILYAEKQGNTGYRFKEMLRDLLKQLGGAQSDRGKEFLKALANARHLNFSIKELESQPTSPAGNGRTAVASGQGDIGLADATRTTSGMVDRQLATNGTVASPLSVVASSIVPTTEQRTAFQNDPTLQNTQITKENSALTAVLLIEALGQSADFTNAISKDGNAILAAMNPNKNTLSELLIALDKAIAASPEAAAGLAPYKEMIARLLAADKASTGTLTDVPTESQPRRGETTT
jgi:hypothetical protein